MRVFLTITQSTVINKCKRNQYVRKRKYWSSAMGAVCGAIYNFTIDAMNDSRFFFFR